MSVWRKCEDVAVVDSGDRVVVLDLAEASSVGPRALEGSGSHIWRLIDGVRSDVELIGELSDSFGVSTEEISTDVRAFLAQLEREGLITTMPSVVGGTQ